MTANKDQIQHLLAKINEVLSHPISRLPWGSGVQAACQRQVLEQVREYLQEVLVQAPPTTPNPTETQAQDVMQSVIQEMNALRSTLLRPLNAEVASLMQQRNALVREIRQLEAHRQLLEQPTPQSGGEVPSIEKLQVVHDRADQVLSTLDTTLSVVFQSLQKDIQSYQDSLSQGIDKLHTLGRQSEAMFSGLVGRLAEQLGRDASTYLQPGALPTDGVIPPILSSTDISMPYPGTELSPVSTREVRESPALDSISSLSELIDQLALEVEELPVAVPVMPPRKGATSGIETPPELRSLFYSDASQSVTSFAETTYPPEENWLPEEQSPSDLNVWHDETILSQLSDDSSTLDEKLGSKRALRSTPIAPPNLPSIFTLDGMDDIFLDDANSGNRGIEAD